MDGVVNPAGSVQQRVREFAARFPDTEAKRVWFASDSALGPAK